MPLYTSSLPHFKGKYSIFTFPLVQLELLVMLQTLVRVSSMKLEFFPTLQVGNHVVLV